MALTAQQIEARRVGIGGSDAPAVVGIDPYRTPLDVYLSKIGQEPQRKIAAEQQFKIDLGNELEDAVARIYAERNGVKIRRRGMMYSRRHPFMLANIDRWIVGGGVLEVKTTSSKKALDEPLESHVVQTMHYMEVTGVREAVIAYLVFDFGGAQFRQYEIEYDPEAAAALVSIEAEFWQHVETRTPPEPVNVNDLQTLFERVDNGKAMTADPEIEALAVSIKQRQDELKAAEKTLDADKDRIKMAMKDHTILLGSDGKPLLTWKQNRDRKVTDWKEVACELGQIIGGEEFEAILAAHTETKPGARVFRLK